MINTSNNPKYTFLLPAYKGRFLKEMLDSIQGQTYTNFKVLISDDCSPEDLYSICEPYLDDPRFEYRRNVVNTGAEHLVSHWNQLLDLCDSEYCIMASDDDLYDAKFLAHIDRMTELDDSVNVFRPLIQHIDDNNCPSSSESIVGDHYQIISAEGFLDLFAKGKILSGISQFVFRTGHLKSSGGFVDFPYAWYSDDATVSKEMGKSGIAICNEVLFSSRVWGQSITGTKDSEFVMHGKIKAAVYYSAFISGLDCIPVYSKTILINRARNLSIRLYDQGSFSLYLNGIKTLKRVGPELFPINWRIRRVLGFLKRKFISAYMNI
ncbi:MAG: glycosyltransferase family 2 protein [Bacteroidales bacterium]|nr:glycosyltransferase family 2 protein [Bacteroidales bacterium]